MLSVFSLEVYDESSALVQDVLWMSGDSGIESNWFDDMDEIEQINERSREKIYFTKVIKSGELCVVGTRYRLVVVPVMRNRQF